MSDDPEIQPRRSLLRRLCVAAVRIVLLGYVTILIALVIMEKRLVFVGAYMDIPPARSVDVDTVSYESADGTKLKGQLYDKPGSQHTVLFLHGNGITAARETASILQIGDELNATVLAAEYRGYDDLEGSPSEAGIIADAIAARDFLCEKQGIAKGSLVLYGQSLGGGCAVAVAADGGAKLLVLDRTFDSTVDVAAEMFWFVPIRLLMRNRFDSVARIQKYDGPLVQMHGDIDDVIPIKHGRRLHESAPSQNKHWVQVEGMNHNDTCPDEAWQTFLTTIRECL